jgi:hypothetical protein
MTRTSIEVLAIFLMFALSVSLHFIWMGAFLNGGELTITINTYGEMWIEYVLWVAVTAIISVGFTEYLNRGSEG